MSFPTCLSEASIFGMAEEDMLALAIAVSLEERPMTPPIRPPAAATPASTPQSENGSRQSPWGRPEGHKHLFGSSPSQSSPIASPSNGEVLVGGDSGLSSAPHRAEGADGDPADPGSQRSGDGEQRGGQDTGRGTATCVPVPFTPMLLIRP